MHFLWTMPLAIKGHSADHPANDRSYVNSWLDASNAAAVAPVDAPMMRISRRGN